VSTYRDYPPPYARPVRPRSVRYVDPERSRSNAAIPVAIAVVIAGLILASYSFVLPALLGVVLLVAGGSFLSTRLNPLSPGFYLTRKPTWAAIGVVFLGALMLLGVAYERLVSALGPFLP
jgi:hypothetical protein